MTNEESKDVFLALAKQSFDTMKEHGVVGLIPLLNEAMASAETDSRIYLMVCALLHAEGTMIPSMLFSGQFMNMFNEQQFSAPPERVALIREMIARAGTELSRHLILSATKEANHISKTFGSTFVATADLEFEAETTTPQVIPQSTQLH